MRTGAVPHDVVVPSRSKKRVTEIARWVLYGAATLAVMLGVLVWPVGIRELGGMHGLAGWIVLAALWTLTAIAARSEISRSSVWWAAGWGLGTMLAAMAQYELRPGSWITVLHVATGLGAIGWATYLVAQLRHVAAAEGTVSIQEAAAQFLASKRIAVTGVSRKPDQHGSNLVYRRLRERGYEVFAVNPNASEIEGDRCFNDLASIPGGVDAVVIATRAERALGTLRECANLGIKQVWMHRAIGIGSVSQEAAAWGRQRGIRVIDGGCPLMFGAASDPGHKIMRSVLTLTRKVPRRV